MILVFSISWLSSEEIDIAITEVEEPAPPSPKPTPPHPPKPPAGALGEKSKGKGERAPTHGLPRCMLLTKDGREVEGYIVEKWPDDFSDTDGGVIEALGDEAVYKINYDNIYHLKYRLSQRGNVAREVVTEKYILGMRILLLGYEHALRNSKETKKSNGTGLAEFADEFRRMAARGAASTVLALAENLPKIIDASAIQGQDSE
jgi:hypothetical protein